MFIAISRRRQPSVERKEALKDKITDLLKLKRPSHSLHEGDIGVRADLSTIGD